MNPIPSARKDKNASLLKITQFYQSNLTPDKLVDYKQLMIAIFGSNQGDSDQLDKSYQRANEMWKQGRLTMDLLAKKVAFLHGLVSNMARKNIVNEQLLQTVESQLQNLVEKQLLKFIEEPKKRESSISKIYSYIRDIASSKEKRKKQEKSQLSLEDCNDKKTIREIVGKVMRPFAFYLLKVLKCYKMYCALINGRGGEEESPFYWKIANWCHSLGDILKQLIRLGHYFTDNFLGLQLLLIYIISIDLTMFYDTLQSDIEKRGNHLLHKEETDPQQEDFNLSPERRSLIQLKELIAEAGLIKESLNQIYCNPKLKEWKKMFGRSEYYKYEESQGTEDPSENILKFIQKQQKIDKQSQLREQLKSSNRGTISYSLSSRTKKTDVEGNNPRIAKQDSTKIPSVHQWKKEDAKAIDSTEQQESKLKLLQFLQNKSKQLQQPNYSLKSQTYADAFIQNPCINPLISNQEDDKPIQNMISRAHKITNTRKMRLMHLTSIRQAKQPKIDIQIGNKRK